MRPLYDRLSRQAGHHERYPKQFRLHRCPVLRAGKVHRLRPLRRDVPGCCHHGLQGDEGMSGRQFVKGNEAVAMAAIEAGVRCYFGYPITPQSDIPEYLARKLPGTGATFIQAESEIAAINMVLGASATGVRAMTSSSGPGISLKQEGISYMAG